eukprot:3551420-Pleurochrysis_carterae.AAC.2
MASDKDKLGEGARACSQSGWQNVKRAMQSPYAEMASAKSVVGAPDLPDIFKCAKRHVLGA